MAAASLPAQLSVLDRQLSAKEAEVGPLHPDVAQILAEMGVTCNEQNRPEEAIPFYERALRIYETSLGPEHADVAQTL
eukprot:804945-Ditylum_brightwellii.AAC.1